MGKRLTHDNRSLEHLATTQSVIVEGIVEGDADTPSFKTDKSEASFRSSNFSNLDDRDIVIVRSVMNKRSPIKKNDLRKQIKITRSQFDSAIITPQRLKL